MGLQWLFPESEWKNLCRRAAGFWLWRDDDCICLCAGSGVSVQADTEENPCAGVPDTGAAILCGSDLFWLESKSRKRDCKKVMK